MKLIRFLIAAAVLTAWSGGFLIGYGLGQRGDTTTIGGTRVPALECQEDEVISWVSIDTLDCVHFEDVAKERR